MSSEEKLLRRLANKKTFEAVRKWLGVLKVPRRDREDVTQEVLLSAWRSRSTYDPTRGRPERWLNRITVYVAAHYHERVYHYREIPSARVAFASSREEAADDRLGRLHTWRRVHFALGSLTEDVRSVLVEYDLKGTPMKELSRRTGTPLSTLYKWRDRGCRALRMHFEASQ